MSEKFSDLNVILTQLFHKVMMRLRQVPLPGESGGRVKSENQNIEWRRSPCRGSGFQIGISHCCHEDILICDAFTRFASNVDKVKI